MAPLCKKEAPISRTFFKGLEGIEASARRGRLRVPVPRTFRSWVGGFLDVLDGCEGIGCAVKKLSNTTAASRPRPPVAAGQRITIRRAFEAIAHADATAREVQRQEQRPERHVLEN